MSAENGTTALLGPLGLSELEEKIYRCLLRWGGGSRDDVIKSTAVSERAARAALASLEQKGLLGRSVSRPKVYIAAPPQAALDILILRRQEDLDQVRLAVQQLAAEAGNESPTADSTEIIEVIPAGEGVSTRNYQMMMGAQREMLGFSVPPVEAPDESFIKMKLDILGRGVKAKVVHTPEVLEVPEVLRLIEAVRPAGEEPRVAAHLPMYLLIVDRKAAFMPARIDKQGQQYDYLVVHPSALLDSLLLLFEKVWDQAVPFEPGGTLPDPASRNQEALLSPDDNRILALLGAGMQDISVAHQLGMGQRTVQRQVRHIMDRLGTTTRFQTGMEATRRGLLGQSRESPDDPASPPQ